MSTDLTALEASYKSALASIQHSGDLKQYLLRRTLESQLARVVKVRESLAIKSYKLVFIGKVGTGKTTAICNLFDLLRNAERGKSARVRTEPLLTAASGRSTICEVEIVVGETTAIEIEPLSVKEMTDLLEDFRDATFARLHPERYEKPTDGLTAETDRAIRNMVSMSKSEHDGKEVDPALDHARRSGDEASFLAELITAAKLDTRNQTLATFAEGDEASWLQECFKELNVGRRAGFSIPRRMRVVVGKRLRKREFPEMIECVVDTKGLDEMLVRADVDRFVGTDNAICFFTSGFGGAPDLEILNYVERHLQDKVSGFAHRCILFVLTRGNEAANVLRPDGNPADDESAGELIKTGHIKGVFQNRGLHFAEENVLYFDAMRSYSREGVVDQDTANEGRDKFISQVEGIVERRKAVLLATATALERELPKLKSSRNSLTTTDANLIVEARTLFSHSSVEVVAPDFVHEMLHYLHQKRRPIQFHAINRRFGKHGETSLFEIARVRAIDLARSATQHEGNRITAVLGRLKSQSSGDIAPFLGELEQQVTLRYEGFIQAAAELIKTEFEAALSPQDGTNEFWRAAISQWGKGPGYWDRVGNDYHVVLDGFDKQFSKMSGLWKKSLADPLTKFVTVDPVDP